jgi:hypothetical protein
MSIASSIGRMIRADLCEPGRIDAGPHEGIQLHDLRVMHVTANDGQLGTAEGAFGCRFGRWAHETANESAKCGPG